VVDKQPSQSFVFVDESPHHQTVAILISEFKVKVMDPSDRPFFGPGPENVKKWVGGKRSRRDKSWNAKGFSENFFREFLRPRS